MIYVFVTLRYVCSFCVALHLLICCSVRLRLLLLFVYVVGVLRCFTLICVTFDLIYVCSVLIPVHTTVFFALIGCSFFYPDFRFAFTFTHHRPSPAVRSGSPPPRLRCSLTFTPFWFALRCVTFAFTFSLSHVWFRYRSPFAFYVPFVRLFDLIFCVCVPFTRLPFTYLHPHVCCVRFSLMPVFSRFALRLPTGWFCGYVYVALPTSTVCVPTSVPTVRLHFCVFFFFVLTLRLRSDWICTFAFIPHAHVYTRLLLFTLLLFDLRCLRYVVRFTLICCSFASV